VLAGPVFGDAAAASTWLVAGLATAPSPLLWSFVAGRIGTVHALTVCYSLQVFGALLAIFGSTPIVLFIAAALFGSTFIGVTMMTIGIGTQMGVANASARLTTWYSIGQIAGPDLVAVALSENIVAAFIASAIALAIAMVLTLIGTLTGGGERGTPPRQSSDHRAPLREAGRSGEHLGDAQQQGIVAVGGHELQADGQALRGESSRHGQTRQPCGRDRRRRPHPVEVVRGGHAGDLGGELELGVE